MKKHISFASILVLLLVASCKKETDTLPRLNTPTLAKKGTDFMITPPKNTVELTYTISGATADVGTTNFAFDWEGTAPMTALRNFACEIIRDKDTAAVFPKKPIIMSRSGILSAGSIIKAHTSYTMHFYFDVAAGTSGTFALKVNMMTDDQQTGFKKSSTITFGAPMVQALNDPMTPDAKQVMGGTEVETFRFRPLVQGQAVTLTTFAIGVATPAAVQAVKVYDSLGTLLGSASAFAAGIAQVPVNVQQAEGEATYVVKLQLKPVTSAVGSNVNAQTSVVSIAYKTISGDTRTSTVSISGNDMIVFKSVQSVVSTTPAGTLTNGVSMTINKTIIYGNGAQKVLTWAINLVDNGPSLDTLKVLGLGIKVNGVPLASGTYFFTNSAGVVIDSLTQADTKLKLTFLGEVANTTNGTTYEVVATPKGYNHADGNVLATTLLVNDPQTSYRHLNAGVAPNNISAKLFGMSAASSGAMECNFIASDRADPSHSAALGASTGDWTDSYLLASVISQQVYTR